MSIDANDLSLPISRCPHCKTAFRVRESQLTQRHGMVRCGACRGVFNAIQHMLHRRGDTITIDALPEVGIPPGFAQTSAQQSPLTLMPGDVSFTPSGTASRPGTKVFTSTSETPEESAPKVQSTDVTAAPATKPATTASTSEQPPSTAANAGESARESVNAEAASGQSQTPAPQPATAAVDRVAESSQIKGNARVALEPEREISTDELEAELEGKVKPVSALDRFERSDHEYHWKSQSPPAAPWATVFWGSSVVVLALALLGHGFYVLRDEMVSRFPAMRTPFAQVCARLGCTIKAPARPEYILIEGAEFTRDPAHTGLYILNATLRNKHSYPAAYPHLVLTLTGVDGQVQSRRVFTPAEFLGGSANLVTGLSGNGEIEFKFWIDASAINPVGFDVRTTHQPPT